MPSQRKRIGFLPSLEVQEIINNICNNNNISQSKVTGILVEEALTSRGMISNSANKPSFEFGHKNNKQILFSNIDFYNDNLDDDFNHSFNETTIKEEVKMINDFIEFKFFKNIMKKNKKDF